MHLNSAHTNTQTVRTNLAVVNPSSALRLRTNNDSSEAHPAFRRIIPLKRKPSFEDQLIEKAKSLVLKNLDNPDYKITNLSRDMTYSQRQLERVIKRLTGFSPVNFVREIRLQEAFRLLEDGVFQTITEVRFEVGMEHPSYFKRKFEERFGISPAELRRRF